jgi:TM2 domain
MGDHAELATDTMVEREPERAIALALVVLLGPFGAHRLYLGTDAKVAVFYGLTFGGFGVLALVDAVHLAVTKDLGTYRRNPRFFMWTKPRPGPTPP